MNCPNCRQDAGATQRKRWSIVRPIFPITLLFLGTVPMRRGAESKFKCPNCRGIFVFTADEMRAAVLAKHVRPVLNFKVGVIA